MVPEFDVPASCFFSVGSIGTFGWAGKKRKADLVPDISLKCLLNQHLTCAKIELEFSGIELQVSKEILQSQSEKSSPSQVALTDKPRSQISAASRM
jgi:hypothetical protein